MNTIWIYANIFYVHRILMKSAKFIPTASPDFNHFFVPMSAVMDDRASDKVCFKLEKRRSTEMLTPGMARISRATSDMY